MNSGNSYELGRVVFSDIDENEYLNELYEDILYNYAVKQLSLDHLVSFKEFNLIDALRFADLLSKSTHPEKESNTVCWLKRLSPYCYSPILTMT